MTPTQIHRPSAALVGVFTAALLALSPLSASATVLFQDNFNNGVVADSDSVTGFWNPVGSAVVGSSLAESGGNLVISLPGSNNSTAQNSTLRSHDGAGPTFNFFTQQLTFTLSGLSVTNPGVGDVGVSASNSILQFYISPSSTSPYTNPSTTPDMVGVRIRANNRVELGFKQDDTTTSNVFSGDSLAHNFTYADTVTGFALTLDATHYSLLIFFDNVETPSTTVSGTHGLSEGAWGAGETIGESGIGLVASSFISSGKANDTLVTLDSLTVTAIPEPSSAAGLAGLAALGLAALRRRRSRT